MRSVTDGEFRRAWFHLDFLQQLESDLLEAARTLGEEPQARRRRWLG